MRSCNPLKRMWRGVQFTSMRLWTINRAMPAVEQQCKPLPRRQPINSMEIETGNNICRILCPGEIRRLESFANGNSQFWLTRSPQTEQKTTLNSVVQIECRLLLIDWAFAHRKMRKRKISKRRLERRARQRVPPNVPATVCGTVASRDCEPDPA